jgi:hypothetical protein
MKPTPVFWAFASLQSLVAALSIAEINGNTFLSSLSGQTVTNVTGLLIAQGPNGVWIRSTTPDDDEATSEAIYVFGSKVGANLTVGDIISLDGKVTEYRSNANYIYLTEIASPTNVQRVSSGNKVTPLVIGKDTLSPPTVQYSELDGGDIYNLPNGVANISEVNPVLDPTKYGLDFWESLSGELVTVKAPRAIKTPNKYGDTWVVGDWAITGENEHGGVTMSDKGKPIAAFRRSLESHILTQPRLQPRSYYDWLAPRRDQESHRLQDGGSIRGYHGCCPADLWLLRYPPPDRPKDHDRSLGRRPSHHARQPGKVQGPHNWQLQR